MATNFTVKIGEIDQLTFIRRLGIPKWSGISQFWFQKVQWHDWLHRKSVVSHNVQVCSLHVNH